MPYQVLARKWRPQTFQAVVGQPYTVQTLMNALEKGRLHPAYLFTGTRGVGKTTLARLVAKALNCEQGVGATPCCQCDACKAISKGNFIDLLEIDAASQTRVEAIRELLSNAQYAPSQGRYKVYLIDEVHMLSTHSFNALLKTLEEPPPHIKFLLATTDPQKLPATILSRCLQFNLKHLSVEQITQRSAYILEQEKISFELAALQTIAKAANGSMRDALSLLDQAISYSDAAVSKQRVQEMLGFVEQEGLLKLLEAIVNNDAHACLTVIDQLAQFATDFDGVLEALLSLLHQIALIQALAKENLATPTPKAALDDEQLQPLAKKIGPEDTQLFYQIALTGRKDIPLAPTPKVGFEMLVLRMLAFRPAPLINPNAPTRQPEIPHKTTAPSQSTTTVTPMQTTTVTQSPMPKLSPETWGTVVQELTTLKGVAKIIVEQCTLESFQGNEITLILNESQKPLLTQIQENHIAQALSQYLESPIKLKIRSEKAVLGSPAALKQQQIQAKQQQIKQAIADEPKIQAIMKRFNATIVHESVILKKTDH